MCAAHSAVTVSGAPGLCPSSSPPRACTAAMCARDSSEGGGVPQRVASTGRWGSGRLLPWGPAAHRCGALGLTLVYVKPGWRDHSREANTCKRDSSCRDTGERGEGVSGRRSTRLRLHRRRAVALESITRSGWSWEGQGPPKKRGWGSDLSAKLPGHTGQACTRQGGRGPGPSLDPTAPPEWAPPASC